MLDLAMQLRDRVLPELGSHAGRADHGEGAGGDVTFAVDELAELELQESSRSGRHGSPTTPRTVVWWRPRTRSTYWWWTRSTAPGPRWPDSSPRASRSPSRRSATATQRWTTSKWVRGRDQDRQLVPGPSRRRDRIEPARGAERHDRRRGNVLGLRVSRAPGAPDGRGARGPDRRLVGRGRDVRARVAVVRDDPDRHGPTRCGDRGWIEDDRRRPGMLEEFQRIGRGEVLNNSPYDLAGPWLCLREAGGVVTDGWGEPLDHHRLLGSGHENQMSSISAANWELHATWSARRTRESPGSGAPGCVRLRAVSCGPPLAPPRGPSVDAPARLQSPRRTCLTTPASSDAPLVDEIRERA